MNLSAGIFVGEFGYELFAWSGYLRTLSKSYDKTVIFCNKGHELLYSDFAECVSFNVKTYGQNGPTCIKHSPFLVPREYKDYHHIASRNLHHLVVARRPVKPQYVKLSSSAGSNAILLHIRQKCSDRDWSEDNWRALLKHLDYDKFSFHFVGSNSQSLAYSGYPIIDSRGLSLVELAKLMGQSKTIIGPSSGIMHFASLCGLHQTVWSSSVNRKRYIQDWNPFNSPVLFLDEFGFNPPPEYVIKELANVLT